MKDVFVVMCGVVAVLFISDFAIERSCNNYSMITGKEVTRMFLDDCYVKTEQGFQRWDEYKARSTASEGLSKD